MKFNGEGENWLCVGCQVWFLKWKPYRFQSLHQLHQQRKRICQIFVLSEWWNFSLWFHLEPYRCSSETELPGTSTAEQKERGKMVNEDHAQVCLELELLYFFTSKLYFYHKKVYPAFPYINWHFLVLLTLSSLQDKALFSNQQKLCRVIPLNSISD